MTTTQDTRTRFAASLRTAARALAAVHDDPTATATDLDEARAIYAAAVRSARDDVRRNLGNA